jgi:hypothetical protein
MHKNLNVTKLLKLRKLFLFLEFPLVYLHPLKTTLAMYYEKNYFKKGR